MCTSVWMCVWAPCVCNASGGQRKVSKPNRLELQTVLGHYVDAGNQSRVLWKSSQYLYLLSLLCNTIPHPHRMRIVTSNQTSFLLHCFKTDPHWSKQEGCVTGTSPPPKKPKWLLHSGMSGAFSKDLEHSVSAVRWELWSPQRAARPPQARLYIRLSGVSLKSPWCLGSQLPACSFPCCMLWGERELTARWLPRHGLTHRNVCFCMRHTLRVSPNNVKIWLLPLTFLWMPRLLQAQRISWERRRWPPLLFQDSGFLPTVTLTPCHPTLSFMLNKGEE